MKKEQVATRAITIAEITARVNKLAPKFSKGSLRVTLADSRAANSGDFKPIR